MEYIRLDISSPRRFKEEIFDKTCPNSSDIEVAREFLVSIGAHYEFAVFRYSRSIDNVVNWMQVKSCILCRRNWH